MKYREFTLNPEMTLKLECTGFEDQQAIKRMMQTLGWFNPSSLHNGPGNVEMVFSNHKFDPQCKLVFKDYLSEEREMPLIELYVGPFEDCVNAFRVCLERYNSDDMDIIDSDGYCVTPKVF